jgi:predicted enzyme related to lactoylglutathione lyase
LDSVIHFEIPADDPKRATTFYKDVFGWQADEFPGFNYWLLITTEVDKKGNPKAPGAINGGLGTRGGSAPKVPTITISVEDVDKSLKVIEKHGGKITSPKQQVGDIGYAAYFNDSEGNLIGLFQPVSRH